jgi:hypothetical protein
MITLAQPFTSVENDKYISLVTFRKSGAGSTLARLILCARSAAGQRSSRNTSLLSQ